MWLLSKVLSIRPMGQGPSWEGGDIPQETMEIFWAKITTILKGIYWGGQLESGIRWQSQGACNNREADGSGPEQLEWSSHFAYPKFAILPPGLLLYLCGAYLGSGIWLGVVWRVFRHGISPWQKNPHREALMPAKSSGALPCLSWETCTDCTSKITLLLAWASSGKLSKDVCMWKHHCCLSRACLCTVGCCGWLKMRMNQNRPGGTWIQMHLPFL